MLKIIVITLISIFFIGCSLDNKEIIIDNNKWQDGDSLIYNVEIKEFKYLNDSLINAEKINYRASLKLSKKDSTSIISWTIMKPVPRMDSLHSLLDIASTDTLDYVKDIEVIYEVNNIGQYKKMVNLKELEIYTDSAWESIFIEEKNDKSVSKERYNYIKSKFLTKNAVEAYFTKDIMSLHLAFGLEVSEKLLKGKRVVAGLNNDVVNSDYSCKIIDKYDNTIVLNIVQELDGVKVSKQMKEMLKEFTKSSDNFLMEVNDTSFVEFDLNNCWPKRVDYWRTLSSDDSKKQTIISLFQIPI